MIKRILFIFMLLFSHLSVSAGITDGKFGINQIFDVQYWWNGTTLNASNFIAPYDKNFQTVTATSGQYFQFFASTTNPGTYGLKLMNADGSFNRIVHDYGDITALGNGAIFYIGSGFFGNVISTAQGYNYGASAQFTNMDTDVTSSDLNNYTYASSTPLAAGQTAQSSTPTVTSTVITYTWRQTVTGNVTRLYRTKITTTNYSDNTSTSTSDPETLYSTATATVTEVVSSNTQQGVVTTTTTRTDTVMADNSQTTSYSSSSVTTPWPSYITIGSGSVSQDITFGNSAMPTLPQQTKVDVWTNKTITDGNKIYIDQVSGSDNTVTMDQDGNKNLINATISGNTNSVTAKQGVPGVGQNEIKLNLTGDSNTLNINQARTTLGSPLGTNGHYQSVEVTGYQNTVTTQQTNTGGVGGQYMETTVNGNQNSVVARQTDNGNKIMFNSITGNNNTVDAVQKGTGQHYLENKLTGNGNSISALQEGSIANRATIDLTNNGGPASVILQQTGGQNVSITTGCATAGGCAPVTVRQGY